MEAGLSAKTVLTSFLDQETLEKVQVCHLVVGNIGGKRGLNVISLCTSDTKQCFSSCVFRMVIIENRKLENPTTPSIGAESVSSQVLVYINPSTPCAVVTKP